jgi:translation initiation factor 1A
MVKNAFGGNKSKGFARKHNNSSNKVNNNLRISEDEGEIYAIVTKMCGNGMFQCYCIDGVERLCHIRGKFTGRKKRDNIVSSGGWVLIGVREWDNKPDQATVANKKKDKIQQCDLLEVYNDGDKDRLKENVQENWKILVSHDPNKFSEGLDDEDDNAGYNNGGGGFKFATEKDVEREILLQEAQSETAEKITLMTNSNCESDAKITEEDWISFEDL